ncbi:phytoene/squalene synthase family protein [Candidatus Bipolaricaulota bacterium]|nr:phytoene/squalene synthase family protein [Candidatus Bipolaricaulota bacterium]
MQKQPEGVVEESESPNEYCKRITKERAKNFYWAIITLPKEKRSAVYSIYTFARRCDDIADGSWDLNKKKQRLAEEREKVKDLYSGRPQDKLYEALAGPVENYGIPQSYFDQLIRGVEMDLTKKRYATFEDLKVYCFRVASVVGLALIEVFGYEDWKAKKYAIDFGLGMQLTNIIRDVAEDYRRDRIYLPQEDLESFECDFEEIDEYGVNEEFRDLMDFEASRARKHFRKGKKLFSQLSPRTRACPAGLYGVYSNLLDKMEASGWDIWDGRTRMSTVRKVSSVLGQWFASLKK